MPSAALVSNLTQEWVESLLRWKLHFFVIPTSVVSVATLVADPVLLSCIVLSRALRRETRYLLVANTLAADILFLVFNLAVVVCNAAGARVPWLLCELITAVTVTAYTCAVFTITLMVVDTYAAVRWPLRYHELLPPERTHRVLLGAWLLAAAYPLVLVVVRVVRGEHARDSGAVCLALISLGFFQVEDVRGVHVHFVVWALVCAALIFFCYARLYMVTRTQGIWQSRFSRARVTLLAHGVLLLLYFTPGLVFILELFLLQAEDMSQDLRVWLSTVNMCVFMLLPRAVAPYLYGLRYRELAVTLTLLLQPHGRHAGA
ncbi:putative G-protein coupled receptor 148 [Liparis tanakae]|uniref:Putative G-protein coupled receptor 148 n=1 Tax=Liparis tanakae TaxID=230148 RepID=A0A4Z2EFF1_9TELE|nr:putative G-protein coupled receptor 148 [Liparis tanakae]